MKNIVKSSDIDFVIYLYKIQVCVSVCVSVCVLPFFSQTDCPIALKFGMKTNWDIADVIAEPNFLISIFFVHNSHLKGYFLPFLTAI